MAEKEEEEKQNNEIKNVWRFIWGLMQIAHNGPQAHQAQRAHKHTKLDAIKKHRVVSFQVTTKLALAPLLDSTFRWGHSLA